MGYDFRQIEKKWQDRWENCENFKAVDFHPTKPKYYVLYEFYNISGNLHTGHIKATVPADALARYKRLCGYNVLFPIGGDAFGLPAENAAIKRGIKPEKFVADGMNAAMEQSKMIGLSFDWSRTVCTSDPDYYKWTQWIFLQLLKEGKAYKKKGIVNFCPKCKTVLSNEDSQGGKCDRCGSDVEQKERWVWFLKMREYSEKMLENVDNIEMAEHLKNAQRNWIGKSEGVEVKFKVVNNANQEVGEIKIFTTCIETIYGVTFLAVAPENEVIECLKNEITNYSKVEEYKKQATQKTEFDRKMDNKEKTGCKLEGVYAINPLNGAKVEIYSADFVLAGYGTGAAMAVPSHDQRDFEFAKKFNIPFIQVIEGDCSSQAVEKAEYLSDNRKMLNSAEFTGLSVQEAKEKITQKVVEMGAGEVMVNFKMQDWPFNRQRYWGEPFPVVFCDKCGTVALDEKDLPLTLPETDDYTANEFGDSPISKCEDWVNCTCPKCGGKAKREIDTMPNWAGSSWYWLRYADPHNDKEFADFEKLKYWGSVDCYMGGVEHITRHILYAFFWQNFLYEIGAVPTRQPFARKLGNGLVLDDTGKKMSKSSANGVTPVQVVGEYGADVTRMHLGFLGAYEDNIAWTYDGINGITSFLNKVWNLQEIIKGDEISKEHKVRINQLIKKAGEDYENASLNTIIASLMGFVNFIKETGYITKEELKIFLILLNPIAPHISSEVYEQVFGADIVNESWPKYDENFLQASEIELPIQINGKVRKRIQIATGSTKEQIVEICVNAGIIKKEDIKKIIFVENKIINFIV